MIFYPQLRAKILEGVVVELFLVVWDQDPRDPIPVDDIPLNKILYILLHNGGQGFNFHPLCEVVYAYYKEFQLLHCYREWSYDV